MVIVDVLHSTRDLPTREHIQEGKLCRRLGLHPKSDPLANQTISEGFQGRSSLRLCTVDRGGRGDVIAADQCPLYAAGRGCPGGGDISEESITFWVYLPMNRPGIAKSWLDITPKPPLSTTSENSENLQILGLPLDNPSNEQLMVRRWRYASVRNRKDLRCCGWFSCGDKQLCQAVVGLANRHHSLGHARTRGIGLFA